MIKIHEKLGAHWTPRDILKTWKKILSNMFVWIRPEQLFDFYVEITITLLKSLVKIDLKKSWFSSREEDVSLKNIDILFPFSKVFTYHFVAYVFETDKINGLTNFQNTINIIFNQ